MISAAESVRKPRLLLQEGVELMMGLLSAVRLTIGRFIGIELIVLFECLRADLYIYFGCD